jgi:hypothetical protein
MEYDVKLIIINPNDGGAFEVPFWSVPGREMFLPQRKDRIVVNGLSYTVYDVEWDVTEKTVRILAK